MEPSVMSTEATPERISTLVGDLGKLLGTSVSGIESINLQARLLAMNAQIEAARAGAAGCTFAIVGRQMVELSQKTQGVARELSNRANGVVGELSTISGRLANDVRGRRLADLAGNNLDLIDRNLYERSCDCRWWATDPAAVDALESPSSEKLSYASRRMGTILRAYTVYFDIVLADLNGRILANGKPELYHSVGQNHSNAAWFKSGRDCSDGNGFGFESVHRSSLVNNQRVLIYSARVNRGGETQGDCLGVLGVVFNWDSLAQTIVRETPLEDEERRRTRVCIADDAGVILADLEEGRIGQQLDPKVLQALASNRRGFRAIEDEGIPRLVAHAPSRGYETYRTGWHSFIIQERVA